MTDDTSVVPAEDIRRGDYHPIGCWTAFQDAEMVLATARRPAYVLVTILDVDGRTEEREYEPGFEVTVVRADHEPTDVEIYGAGAR